jgi:hypothetical protein
MTREEYPTFHQQSSSGRRLPKKSIHQDGISCGKEGEGYRHTAIERGVRRELHMFKLGLQPHEYYCTINYAHFQIPLAFPDFLPTKGISMIRHTAYRTYGYT